MTPQSKHALRKFYYSLVERNFDQNDVERFFTNSRDYSQKNSIIREIGDFIAHPQKKEKGMILESFLGMEKPIEEFMFKNRHRKNLPIYNGLGTGEKLINEINKIFKKAGLEKENLLISSPSIRELISCLIFLLSGFKVELEFQSIPFKEEVRMEVFYSSDLSLQAKLRLPRFPSTSFSITILRVREVWPDCPRLYIGYRPKKLENHICRRFTNNLLAAIDYKKDLKSSNHSLEDFNSGEIWPISSIKN